MARAIVPKRVIRVDTYCVRGSLVENAPGGSAMKKTEEVPDELEAALVRLATSTRVLEDTRKFEAAKDVYIAAGNLHDLRCDAPDHDSASIVQAYDNAIAALQSVTVERVSFRRIDFLNNISRWRHLATIHG